MAVDRVPKDMVSSAFLGVELRDAAKMKKIDTCAQILFDKNVLHPVTPTEISQANGIAIGAIAGLGGGADQVSVLVSRASAANTGTNASEKQMADVALDVLAKSTFVVMRHGGDTSLVATLNTPASVDAALPTAMKGLGQRVMDNIIENADLMKELQQLDAYQGEALLVGGVKGKKMMGVEVDGALDRVMALKVPANQADERKMVLALLGSVAETLEGTNGGGGLGDLSTLGRDIADASAEGQREMAREISKKDFDTLVDDLMSENAWERQSLESELFFDNPSLVGETQYMTEDGIKRWKSILRIALAGMNFTRYKRGGAKPEEMMQMPGIGNSELEKIKTNELGILMSTEPAFREAARRVFRGIFKRDEGDFPGGNRRSEYTQDGRFFIKALKDGDIDTGEYMASMDRIVKGLVKDRWCDENMAKIFVSMAGHVFIDGSMAIDSADIDRVNNNRTPDPDRVLIHPLWKVIQKAGFTWAGVEISDKWNYNVIGRVGDLVQKLVQLDRKKGVRDFTKKLLSGEWRYIPERTGASWTEMSEMSVMLSVPDLDEDGKRQFKEDGSLMMRAEKATMSPAEFLLTVNEEDLAVEHVAPRRRGGEEAKVGRPDTIVFGRGGDDHIFGSFIRDWWPATVLWGMAFKGKLPMKDASREMGDFLSDWSNKMQDLRKIEVPGWEYKWKLANPEKASRGEKPKDEDKKFLLDPWLRDPYAIVGGILNVVNKELLLVDTPLLPNVGGPDVLAVHKIVDSLTGLDDSEKQKVYDILSVPNITGVGEAKMSAIFFQDGLSGRLGTKQSQRREELKRQSLRNIAILKT
ncbi:MAG: hypothetical protein WAV41_02145 [Microgenomates group bacterium]